MSLGKSFVIAAPLCFVAGIYIPHIFPIFYFNSTINGITSDFTQPWHNSTYLTMRMFSLLCIAKYFSIHSHYLETGVSVKDWFSFFLLLTLANASKPNFIIPFAPAVLVFLIVDFCRTKGSNLKSAVKIGSAVLCSLPVLVFQSSVLFPHEFDGNSGVILTLDLIKKAFGSGYVVGYLLLGFSFAVAITVICINKKETTWELAFVWVMYGFAFIERWFLVETGERALHGNFQWGISFAGLALMVICVERFYAMREKINLSIFLLLKLVLTLMIVSGLVYFVHCFQGGSYGI